MNTKTALLRSLAIADADTPTLIAELKRRAKDEKDRIAKALFTKEPAHVSH